MRNHCKTCAFLLSEETSKAVGTEYNCTFNPIWSEIIGPAAHFCGRWEEHPRVHEEKQRMEMEAQRVRWEDEHRQAMIREEARAKWKIDQEKSKREEMERIKTFAPPPFKVAVEEPDQAKLSLREKMKRRFKS